MIHFKSEIKEYEDRIRANIPRLVKALKKDNIVTINHLLEDIFDCTCINNAPVVNFDCMKMYCSECKEMFVRELIVKYGKKNNVKW